MARVLIIDDDENNRRLLKTLLEHAGHAALEESSGSTGLQAALAHEPDAVIVDLSLPDIPGAQVIRKLRSDARTAKVRIALYTATQTTPALDELVESFGVWGIIPKPGDPREILEILKRLAEP